MMQPGLFSPAEHAALAARAALGPYVPRAIWRGIFEAGAAHGREGGGPLPRNRYGAAPPTPAARAVLDGYFGTHVPDAPMNRDVADLFEAGRRHGVAARRRSRA